MKAWTDYPFVELGDAVGKPAPIRRCVIQSYDGDKYCRIQVDGLQTEIKAGYLYSEAGRHGEVPNIDVSQMEQNP